VARGGGNLIGSAMGIPAHITLVYPFAAPEAIDAGAVSRLRALFRRAERVAYSLVETRRFGDQVLYLAPSPDEPFRLLTKIIMAEFPDYPPYGGAFSEVIPHLTIADGAPARGDRHGRGGRHARLPLRCSAAELGLWPAGRGGVVGGR